MLLDITRLTSRVGRGALTGVDRVEMAYLDWCLSTHGQLHGLARIASGYALLDRNGLARFTDRLKGAEPWGRRDARALVGVKTPKPRGAAESDLRRLAISLSNKARLPDLPDALYLNTGHSNLRRITLEGVRAQGLRTAILVHDTIPLDFPQFQRDGSADAFAQKLRLSVQHADLIISNSKQTKQRVKAHAKTWGDCPPVTVAHLGLDARERVEVKAKNRPYFTAIGTIEPRKNHTLLLDIWEDMTPDERPDLHFVGKRGWKNEALFAWLDQLKSQPWLHLHEDMDDPALTRHLSGAHALLFPSFAEGFGLPSLEAAQLGIPVICGDLAIHRELLGDYPVYADLEDRYFWKKTILEQAAQRQKDLVHAHMAKRPHIPTWSEHFAAVNAAVMKLV
ncbi:glycosyltransferase family 4 protein [Litoreibacter ponti]|uniref:glycosyltransferase family 4 protein n=1 Tax=Litoreibacter ponti TaxID=1510457 RepID=UPI001304CE5A|nr:glycosyltransferase family 1 protein [Litoreibacter ponti]